MEAEGRATSPEWSATLAEAYGRALAFLDARDSGTPPTGKPDQPKTASPTDVGTNRHEEAIELYRAMLASLLSGAPGSHDSPMRASALGDINLWLGHALRITGRAGEAVEAYRAAAAACPDFGDSWWSLANLKTYRFADSEIAAMIDAQSAPATTGIDRVHLCFALGKAFEDQADYPRAWRFYAQGNALQCEANRYRPEIFATAAAEQRRVCTRGFFEARRGWGDPAPDPIFVLGLPRSGSTVIEQILASHSAVDGTWELPTIQRLVFELQNSNPNREPARYPAALETLSAEDCRRLGERYIALTRFHRGGRPYFVDKMPDNFIHVGLIALILPNARIIDARREPMACCFSNLKQLFVAGRQEFSYSIEDVARHYRTYLELMRHWDAVLPGKVLTVCHEDLVGDLGREVRRILAHCSLPFEASCLSFHETRRSVHTPSSEQVRQPISRDSLDQWRNFEFALGPLTAALGDALAGWRS